MPSTLPFVIAAAVIAMAAAAAQAQDAPKSKDAPPAPKEAAKPQEPASASPPAAPAPPPPPPPETKPIDTVPAQNAALAWLEIVDAGGWGRSWDAGSSMFKAVVTREKWEVSIALARGPLGALVIRKARAVRYLTELPTAPEGEYVIMEFDAVFGERRYIETLSVMREADGSWRVMGYFIR